jgi:hypothetical protein
MTGRFRRGLVAIGLVLATALPAFASGEIEEARASLDTAESCLKDKCWEQAERNANIGSLDGIADAKKAPLLKEAADIKKACAARDPSEDHATIKGIRSDFRRARIALDGVEDEFGRRFPPGTKPQDPQWESALSTLSGIDKAIKDDADRSDPGVTPELKKEFDAKIAELRKRCVEAQVAQELNGAERIFQEIENPKTEKNAWFFNDCLKKEPEIKEHLDKLPKDHPKVQAAYARLDKDLAEARKNLGSAERDEAVGPAIKQWKELKEKIAKEYAGWEKSVCPPHTMGKWDEFQTDFGFNNLKKCTDRIYDVDQFLTGFNDMGQALKSKFKDDPELQGCVKEGKAIESETGELICKIVNQVFDTLEKEVQSKEQHQAAMNQAKNFVRNLDSWHTQFAPSYEATKKRGEAIVGKAEGENAAAAAKVEEWKTKLTASCDPFWTEATKHYSESDFVKLNSHDMVLSIGSVKGKKVRFVKAGNWLEGEFYNDGVYAFIVDANGPVAFKYDAGLLDAYRKGREATGVHWNQYPDPIEDVIGVVDGTCTVDHQAYSQITKQHYKTGVQTEAVLVRVTSYKSTPWALVEGKGTNLSKIPGATDFPVNISGSSGAEAGVGVSTSSGGGSSRHGFLHMMHRFMAWGMCALLALGGALALAHGASKFVPAIQEQKVKLGDYLGYAGFGFAGIGVVWFCAAIAFWVFEGKGGSLPSVALVFAGAFTGLDVLRSKGKLTEETASMIQPAGILLGLACFGAAAIHFLAWDWTLL